LHPTDLLSSSRIHCVVRARAVVAWLAMTSGTASLSEVARRFTRSTATISRSISTLRRNHPELLAGEPPTEKSQKS
jgi:chromosomal replication initiation ATPase DnaA